jgi:hypothetical protein
MKDLPPDHFDSLAIEKALSFFNSLEHKIAGILVRTVLQLSVPLKLIARHKENKN